MKKILLSIIILIMLLAGCSTKTVLQTQTETVVNTVLTTKTVPVTKTVTLTPQTMTKTETKTVYIVNTTMVTQTVTVTVTPTVITTTIPTQPTTTVPTTQTQTPTQVEIPQFSVAVYYDLQSSSAQISMSRTDSTTKTVFIKTLIVNTGAEKQTHTINQDFAPRSVVTVTYNIKKLNNSIEIVLIGSKSDLIYFDKWLVMTVK